MTITDAELEIIHRARRMLRFIYLQGHTPTLDALEADEVEEIMRELDSVAFRLVEKTRFVKAPELGPGMFKREDPTDPCPITLISAYAVPDASTADTATIDRAAEVLERAAETPALRWHEAVAQGYWLDFYRGPIIIGTTLTVRKRKSPAALSMVLMLPPTVPWPLFDTALVTIQNAEELGYVRQALSKAGQTLGPADVAALAHHSREIESVCSVCGGRAVDGRCNNGYCG